MAVIVPFLDAAAFLEETILSVFDQSHDAWELILVDDGASDGSSAIARRWAARHAHRVRYIEHDGHQNRGTAASRNAGVRHATAPLLAFLDADDVWLPHKLARQVAVMEATPEAGMLYGRSEYWASWTGRPEHRGRDVLFPLGVPAHEVIRPPALIRPFFLQKRAAIPCPSNVLVRRDVVEAVGGFVEEFHGPYRSYEDQAFFAKVLVHAPVMASDECWDRYRQHAGSAVAVARAGGLKHEARVFFLDWLAAYLADQGLKDQAIWSDLERERQSTRRLASGATPPSRVPTLLAVARRVARARAVKTLAPEWRTWVGRRVRGTRSRPASTARPSDALRRSLRLAPASADAGESVESRYIRLFLTGQAADIRGRVLEVGDAQYARQVRGAPEEATETFHIARGSGPATFVGHLASLSGVPNDAYDCVLALHVLHLADDVPAAVRSLHRVVVPGGIVVATLPGIRPVGRLPRDGWGDDWRFTARSARRLFAEVFRPSDIVVASLGNRLTATVVLHDLSAQALAADELAYDDPDYPVVITVRARKSAGVAVSAADAGPRAQP